MNDSTTWHRRAGAALVNLALAALAALAACGGGNGSGGDALGTPPLEDIGGTPCASCRAGIASGMVSIGGALAGADVTVFDAAGRSARGRTDGAGRFEIDVGALRGDVLLQVQAVVHGRPLRLHALARAVELGQRSINVNAISELIAATVLGGPPGELLDDARVDFRRIDSAALRGAEARIEALLRPLLDAAGVERVIDLRLAAMQADGSGLDRALGWLELIADDGAYLLRHAATAEARRVGAGGGGAAALDLDAAAAARLQAAQAALPELRALLDTLSALFAGPALPSAEALREHFSAELRHAGLDREAYIERVLLRADAAARGGFSLAGARWGEPRLLEVAADGRLRLAFVVTPRAPFEPEIETTWVQRVGARWQFAGDGQAVSARLREAALLGAAPLTEAEVRALPGIDCGAVPQQPCRIDGAEGWLDLGLASSASFGSFAWWRSTAAGADERLAAVRHASRSFGTPSAAVQVHLLFEIDARRVDPRARRALVFGPGLPPQGLALVPPPTLAGAPRVDHWVLDSGAGEPWAGVRHGWCDWSDDGPACAQAWQGLREGTPYRVHLLDGGDALLAEQVLRLPARPRSGAAWAAERERWFAQWRVGGASPFEPGTLLAAPGGSALALELGWRAPQHTRVLHAELEWHRASFPHGERVDRVDLRRLPEADTPFAFQLAGAPEMRSTWLVARLVAGDDTGRRFVHYLAPSNPR